MLYLYAMYTCVYTALRVLYTAQHMLYAAQCICTRTLYAAQYNYITRGDGQPSVHIDLHVYRRQYHPRYYW